MELSSSSSSSVPQYDIFVSFRGPDVRSGFLSHLIEALDEERIDVCIDDELERGCVISTALLEAIENSRISLIIFSQYYASSKWCLEELVQIMDCMKRDVQLVIPIFYNIDPSYVRHQRGSYAIAFVEHEKNYRNDMIKVQNWRTALYEAANLSGFHSSNFRTEAQLIREIVQTVSIKLSAGICQTDFKNHVGIQERIAQVQLLLRNKAKDVCVIGIWGMGGIGKTTLANALFDKFCSRYKGCCFSTNVREELKKSGQRIERLKKKLFSTIFKEKETQVGRSNTSISPHVIRRLAGRKALILLDDVYNPEHSENLIGGQMQFGPRSIIIVTSRDKHVLSKADVVYEVEAMNTNEAFQLFSLNAFKQDYPETEWIDLSSRAVDYAHGNPLALKVLGSFLLEKSAEEWESQLEKLKKMPLQKTQRILRLSYDELDREDQDIFLYIACYFKGGWKVDIKILLNACGYSTTIGLRKLQDKALIKVFEDHIWMHDLIQAMGQEIVREESFENLGNRRHLWDSDDIYQVLKNNKGTEGVKSISLDMSRIKPLSLTPQAFAKMINLKFLKLFGSRYTVHLSGGLESLPDDLILLEWAGYPSNSLPPKFCVGNLVELSMPDSRLEKLWDGVQDVVNLKKIDVHGSKRLTGLPDLSKAANLEIMDLCQCFSLVCVPPSVLSLPRLEELLLNECINLKSLRSDVPLKSLQWLNLQVCKRLKEFSVASEKMDFLYMIGCKSLGIVPNQLCEMRFVDQLNLKNCRKLDKTSLSNLVVALPSLKRLVLHNCYNLFELPDNISVLSKLNSLSLSGTNVELLPASLKHLPRLASIYVRDCKRLKSIAALPVLLEGLYARNCISLETLSAFTSIPELLNEPNIDSRIRRADLFFMNCINLDEHAVSSIMEYAHYRIKHAACAQLMLQKVGDGIRRAVDICLPGTKVPDWFHNFCHQRKKGHASVTIPVDLSPHSKFMGFIFCIIVSKLLKNEKYELRAWGCECYIEASGGERLMYCLDPAFHSSNASLFPKDHDGECYVPPNHERKLKSDHMLLWFDSCSSNQRCFRAWDCENKQSRTANDQCTTLVDITFEFQVKTNRGMSRDVIKEIGVYPIYASKYLDSTKQMKLENYLNRIHQQSKSGRGLFELTTESLELETESGAVGSPGGNKHEKVVVPQMLIYKKFMFPHPQTRKNQMRGLQEILFL